MSLCDVDLLCASEDYWTWWTERRVARARKPHACVNCPFPIRKGEPYHYTVGRGLDSGTMENSHHHEACWELLHDFETISPCPPPLNVQLSSMLRCAEQALEEMGREVQYNPLARVEQVRAWLARARRYILHQARKGVAP